MASQTATSSQAYQHQPLLQCTLVRLKESNSSDSQEEKEETTVKASHDLDPESITNTVTSSLSMQEYFAQRMAHLKKARGQAHCSDTSEMSGLSGESSPVHCTSADQPEKKKKKKDQMVADEATEEKCGAFVLEINKESQQVNPEQRKKKRKVYKNEQTVTPEEEMPPSKKKKKHKKDTEPINGHDYPEDDIVQPEVNETEKHEKECVLTQESEVEKKYKKDKKKEKETGKGIRINYNTSDIFYRSHCVASGIGKIFLMN